MPTMTLRIDEETSRRLDELAAATERSRSWLAQKALSDFLALNAWQVGEIEAGIKEANAGEFVEHTELKQRWEAKLANPLD
jgi:predicted transcriptional regulator